MECIMDQKYQNIKRDISLDGLFGRDRLQEIQNSLSDVTGISFQVIDYRGNAYIDYNGANTMLQDFIDSDVKLEELRALNAMEAAKAAIYNRSQIFGHYRNLLHMAIPIVVNEQYLGALIGGPVYRTDVDQEDKLAGVDDDEIYSNLDVSALPRYSGKKVEAIARIAFLMVREMCEKETVALQVDSLKNKVVSSDSIKKRNRELELEIRRMEYQSLRGQLPAQLLLNLYTTISYFAILENASKTERMITDFAQILRYYVDNKMEDIALSQEADQIDIYLRTLKEQYNHKLNYQINIQKEVEWQRIPVLGLLPMVEHFIDFGVLSGNYEAMLYIDAEQVQNRCRITMQLESSGLPVGRFGAEIIDSGFSEFQVETIKKRYEYLYNQEISLTVNPNTIVLNIPLQQKRKY